MDVEKRMEQTNSSKQEKNKSIILGVANEHGVAEGWLWVHIIAQITLLVFVLFGGIETLSAGVCISMFLTSAVCIFSMVSLKKRMLLNRMIKRMWIVFMQWSFLIFSGYIVLLWSEMFAGTLSFAIEMLAYAIPIIALYMVYKLPKALHFYCSDGVRPKKNCKVDIVRKSGKKEKKALSTELNWATHDKDPIIAYTVLQYF